MHKIAILGVLQQQAEALGTQFQPIYALYNTGNWNTNLKEMKSSKSVIYCPYNAKGVNQETIEILKLIKTISPNVIYINSLRQMVIIGLILRLSNFFSKMPLIIGTSHNSTAWKSTTNRILIAFFFTTLADGVITLATYQERWLKKYQVPALKISTISNPVDVEQFAPVKSELRRNTLKNPVLLNVGGIHPLKNQEVLIKALRYVKEEFPTIKLLFTGGRNIYQAYENYLNELIVECNVRENVTNIGYQDHANLPQVYRSCDISLVSSLSEVCPFVVLESLATGRVTIATPVGGIPDLIEDGVNGFLVEPNDVGGFSNCILKVLRDQSLKSSIEKKARESAVYNFSYQVIGAKHKEFISSIIGDKG